MGRKNVHMCNNYVALFAATRRVNVECRGRQNLLQDTP